MKIEVEQLKQMIDGVSPFDGPFDGIKAFDVRQKRNGDVVFKAFAPKLGGHVVVTFDRSAMRIVKTDKAAEK